MNLRCLLHVRVSLALLLCSSVVTAQRLVVEGPAPCSLGERTRVALVLYGAEDFSAWRLGSLPSRSGVRFVTGAPEKAYRGDENGTVEVRVWTLDVTPVRSGRQTLGRFSLVSGEATLATDVLFLDVTRPAAVDIPMRLEVLSERTEYYVGETATVTVRVAFDADFVRKDVLQPFRSRLDVPVQLTAPCLDDIAGQTVRPLDPQPDTATLACNGRFRDAARGVLELDGEGWETVTLSARVFLETAGPLDLGEPFLKVLQADGTEVDFFGRRRLGAERNVILAADVRGITVEPVPTVGRPAAFAGASGVFEVSVASAPLDRLEVGAVVTVEVVVRGAGNLATVTPPVVESGEHLRVLGILGGSTPEGERRFTYEISAVRPMSASALTFALHSFDPTARAFVVARSAPVTIEVFGSPTDEPTESKHVEAPVAGVDDIFESPTESAHLSTWSLSVGLSFVLLPWMVFAGFVAMSRRRRSASAERVRRASRHFHRLLRRTIDPRAAFVEFIVRGFGLERSAAVSFDLTEALTERGVSPEAAARCAHVVFRDSAHRFGVDLESELDDVADLVARLVAECGR